MSTSSRLWLFRMGIVVVTIGLTITAAISLTQIRSLSLPISTITATAALILPLITGAGIQQAQSLVTRSNKLNATSSIPFSWKPIAAILLLTIYETVIATLALTHMVPPGNLQCHLNRQWSRLYSDKDADTIRRIQDAHKCCGLHHVTEMAWPFQDGRNHAADACAKMFGREESCFGEWRRDEQIVAGLLLIVAVGTFVVKLAVFFLYRSRSSFFGHTRSQFPALTNGHAEEESVDGINGQTDGVQGRIEGAYRDDPEVGPDSHDSHKARAQNASSDAGETDHGPIVQPSRLRQEGNEWEQ